MEKFLKKSTKERERKQKKKKLNYVQLHKINKSSSYTTNCIQGCMKNENKNTLLNLSSHHTLKAVQLIYGLMKGQVQYERCKNCEH